MRWLNEIPFVRILLPFLAGLIFYLSFLPIFNLYLYLCTSIAFTFCLWILLRKSGNSTLKLSFGIFSQITLILLGYQVTYQHNQQNNNNHYTHLSNIPQQWVLQLTSNTRNATKTLKAEAQILYALYEKSVVKTEGKLIVYFEKKNLDNIPKYGDVILAKGSLKEISAPVNPGAFDFKSYCRLNNIFHSLYLPKKNFLYHQNRSVSFLKDISFQLQQKLLNLLKQNKLTGQELAIASSLLLGYTDDLDDELGNAYATTGTIHVLSVSGLHIGIIFFVLNFILGFLEKRKGGIYVKGLLVLGGVWLFAMISGLSPSCVRAALMFSLFIFGKTFRQENNIFNTLLSSAFLILLYDPFLISNVGFQLSYLALGGILFFQPYIYKWFEIENYALDKIWALTSVSLAAQLFTFPLTIYYFHNFSVSFLIANLLIIPMSTIIMYLGIFVLLTSFFNPLSSFLAMLLKWLIFTMNSIAVFISQIPYSSFNHLHLNLPQLIFLYLMLILLSVFFIERHKKSLYWSMGFFIVFLFLLNLEEWKRQDELIVFSSKQKPLIGLFHSNNAYLIGNPAPDVLNYTEERATNVKTDSSLNTDFILQQKNGSILSLNSIVLPELKTSPDVLVLSNTKFCSFKKIKEQWPNTIIIADANCKFNTIKKWKTEADSLHLNFHSVYTEGAIILNLRKDNETKNWR